MSLDDHDREVTLIQHSRVHKQGFRGWRRRILDCLRVDILQKQALDQPIILIEDVNIK